MTEASSFRTHARAKEVLSSEQREIIGSELKALVDLDPSIQDRTKAEGFAAFEVWQAYQQDYSACFLRTEEERKVQDRYENEMIKLRLSLGTYRSPLLMDLHQKRIEDNGCSDPELAERYPGQTWRLFADPLQRRKYKEITRIKATELGRDLEAKQKAMLKQQREAFHKEVPRHATGLAKAYAYTTDASAGLHQLVETETGKIVGATKDKEMIAARAEFYLAAMEKYAGPLGFAYDEKLSTKDYPIYSKRVGEACFLAFVIDDVRTYILGRGSLGFELQVRSPQHKGKLTNKGRAECTVIPYHVMVPAFWTAYRDFDSLDEVETIIKAHMYLYSLIAHILEGAIVRALEEKETSFATSTQGGMDGDTLPQIEGNRKD